MTEPSIMSVSALPRQWVAVDAPPAARDAVARLPAAAGLDVPVGLSWRKAWYLGRPVEVFVEATKADGEVIDVDELDIASALSIVELAMTGILGKKVTSRR